MELPAGWVWAELGELANSVKNGIYVSRPGAVPNGVPILRISAVRPMALDTSDLRYTGMTREEVRVKGGLLEAGDLLFTRYNGNPRLVGACARVPDGLGALSYPDKLIRASVSPEHVDSRYICYAWSWSETQRQVRQHVKTTAGQAGIAGSSLKKIRIPLPPLAEQRRIVEALEGHLSRLDAAADVLRTASAKAKVLAPRLMAAQFGAAGGEVRSLSDVAEVRLGRQRSPKNHEGDDMRPYLRAANVGWEGLLLGDVKKMNFTDKELVTYRLERNDILLSEASGSPGEVGKPAIWNEEIEDCCFQNTLIRVRPKEINPHYLFYFLRCSALRGDFRAGSRGVGIHHLGAAKLSSWPIPVPSEEAQARVVEALDAQLSALTAASALFEGDRAVDRTSSALRSALLSRAFAGTLVTQDPADEPATALLARIQAERAAQSKAKRPRRTPAAPRKASTPAAPAPAPAPTPAPTHAVQQEFDL